LQYFNLLSGLSEEDDTWNEFGIEKKIIKKVLISSIISLRKKIMLLKEKNKLNDRLKKEFG
jgi:hypothetical protein